MVRRDRGGLLMKTLIAVAILFALPLVELGALADEAKPSLRTIDMTVPIFTEQHLPLKEGVATKDDPECEKCMTVTVGTVIARTLEASLPDIDRGVAWDQPWKYAALGEYLRANKEAELTTQQKDVIEQRLGKLGFNGLMVLQVMKVLEPGRAAPEVK